MIFKRIIYKYNKLKSGERFSYLSRKYKGRDLENEEFHKYINKEYYKYFSVLYKSRNTFNIEKSLEEINNKIKKFKLQNIYDLGSGEGFINKIFKASKISYKKFYNCDPYQKPSFDDAKSTHLIINFEEAINQISKSDEFKLITLSSTLHHMIEPFKELNRLFNSMKSGDLILISHEPINSLLSTIAHIIMKSISKFFSKKENIHFHNSRDKKYKKIIRSLKENKITIEEIPPLVVRRIIDYQVGYKLDYLKLDIPNEFNEGYWSYKDTIKILKENNFIIIKSIKYPYISSEIKHFNIYINKLFYLLKLNTQYNILAKKL